MRNISRLFEVANRSLFRIDSELSYDRTLDTLSKLAQLVDDYDGDIDWSIGECGECTLDSLLAGAYWYCADYHGGMGSTEYSVLSAISAFFEPNCSSLERDSSEFDVYVALAVKSGHGDWDQIVEDYDNDE